MLRRDCAARLVLKEGKLYFHTIRFYDCRYCLISFPNMLSPGKPISAVDTRPVILRDARAVQMRRVNINLLPVEYDRAAGELGLMVRRVAVSQR